MKKYYKKIISLAIILILILGLTHVFKNFINISKAQTPDPFSGSTATGTTKTTTGTTDTSGTTGTASGEECDLANDGCKLPDPPAPYNSKENELTISEGLKKGSIATAWALSLDLVNILAIFVLLAIAFANILHLGERDSFNFKRMIPAFVIGLIAANLSHLISRAIIDFAGMLMNFFVPKELAAQVVGNIYTGMFGGWFGAGALGVGIIAIVVASLFGFGCPAIIIALILLGVPVIISFILWFLLAARVYVLWFLVILSPIAFFGMFFDPLKRTIGTWWNWFLMWTFMGPIAYFFIYLAEGFSRDTSLNGDSLSNQCLDPSNAAQVGGLQKYLIVNILLVLAVYVPYALGSKIGMGLWGGIGKFLGVTGAKLGFGAGGGAIERAGQKLGWKKTQNLGKSIRQVPYLPGAIFGKEGVLENMNKASTKEAQTDIEKRLKTKLPHLMREQNRESIVKNGSEWEGSAEGFKNGAISAIGSGREDLQGSNLRALGIKAQGGHGENQSEMIKAAELLKEEFGVSVEEATACGFGDIHDSTNAVTISKEYVRKKREEKKQAKIEKRKPRDAAELRAEIDGNTLPSVEDQLKSGIVPEQGVGVFEVKNPERFRKPEEPEKFEGTDFSKWI